MRLSQKFPGKDFERYYNRAREEAGILFIKSRITQILPMNGTGDLLIRYTDEAQKRIEEAFDLVVLSVGFAVPKEAIDLARRLDIHLDPYSFTTTSSFEPVQTSKPGVFVWGAFQGPKDIPTSVIESSASAAMAERILADSRWSMTKTKTIPEEMDVRGEFPRIGVFVCKCGTNIAGVLDVPAIAEYARSCETSTGERLWRVPGNGESAERKTLKGGTKRAERTGEDTWFRQSA